MREALEQLRDRAASGEAIPAGDVAQAVADALEGYDAMASDRDRIEVVMRQAVAAGGDPTACDLHAENVRLRQLSLHVVQECYLPADQTVQCGCCGAVWWDVLEEVNENWHAEGCEVFAAEVALGRSVDVRRGPAPTRHSPWERPQTREAAEVAIKALRASRVVAWAQGAKEGFALAEEHAEAVTRGFYFDRPAIEWTKAREELAAALADRSER